jgi:hypothetical protein
MTNGHPAEEFSKRSAAAREEQRSQETNLKTNKRAESKVRQQSQFAENGTVLIRDSLYLSTQATVLLFPEVNEEGVDFCAPKRARSLSYGFLYLHPL